MPLTPKTARHAIVGAPAAGRYLAAGTTLIPITDPVTRLGRSLSAEVELDDATVSRRHALLVQTGRRDRPARRRRPQRHVAQRQRVDRAVLHDGDTIELGTAQLRYVIAG